MLENKLQGISSRITLLCKFSAELRRETKMHCRQNPLTKDFQLWQQFTSQYFKVSPFTMFTFPYTKIIHIHHTQVKIATKHASNKQEPGA